MKDTITFKIHFTADLSFNDMPKELADEVREALLKFKTNDITKDVKIEEIKDDDKN